MSYEAVLVQLEPGSQEGQQDVQAKFRMLIRQSSANASSNTNANPTTTAPNNVVASQNGSNPPRFQIFAISTPQNPFAAGGNGTLPSGSSTARPAPTRLVFPGPAAPKNLIKVGEVPVTIARNMLQGTNGAFTLKNASLSATTLNPQTMIANPAPVKQPTALPIKQQQIRYQTGRPAVWNVMGGGGGGNLDLSTTPDSGIQSVPGTPNAEVLSPPTTELFNSFSEDVSEENESFDDMPLLLPANQEENLLSLLSDSLPQQGINSRNVDDSVESGVHGSECEQPSGPSSHHSINISPNMDPSEIAEIIAQRMDPEKVKTLTNLMRKKAKLVSKETHINTDSYEWPLKKEGKGTGRKRSRPSSGGSEETRRSEEEGALALNKVEIKRDASQEPSNKIPKVEVGQKKRQRQTKSVDRESNNGIMVNDGLKDEGDEERASTSQTQPTPPVSSTSNQALCNGNEHLLEYRKAARDQLNQRVEELWQKIGTELMNLRIHEKKRESSTKSLKFPIRINWDEIEKRLKEPRKKRNDQDKLEHRSSSRSHSKTKRKTVDIVEPSPIEKKEPKGGLSRSSKNGKIKGVKATVKIQIPKSETKKTERSASASKISANTDDYQHLNTSTAVEGGRVSGWSHPPPNTPCGCKKECGDSCLYRLIRIQCTSSCQAENCQNKPFLNPCDELYVEERSRGKNKEQAKKVALYSRRKIHSGAFLCEFAGEVVNQKEMERRIKQEYKDKDKQVRALALCSRIFVDATSKGNLGRFVSHSCQPNAEFQVWLVNGRMKAGIFAKQEIEKETEITVSFSRQSPLECCCECKRCLSQKSPSITHNRPARNPHLAMADDICVKEETIVQKEALFLLRNRSLIVHRAVWNGAPIRLLAVDRVGKGSKAAMKHILQLVAKRARYPDGSMPLRLLSFYSNCIHSLRFGADNQTFIKNLEQFSKESNSMKLYKKLVDRYLYKRSIEEKVEAKEEVKAVEIKMDGHQKEERQKKRMSGVNFDYLHCDQMIGSYDPDEAWPQGKANECDEAVRCICGSLEEDGEMLQCDECHYWLHNDCIGMEPSGGELEEYKCNFCNGKITTGRPSTDVNLKNQPEVSFPGCTYFKALVNEYGIQVRLNETIYVEKLTGDEHKKALKKSLEHSEAMATENDKKIPKTKKMPPTLPTREFARRNVGIMRVERLILTSDGKRWIFGFYYARPHETFKDPTRKFHPNEVLSTQMYDTLPLNSAVGRCSVLPASIWKKGHPSIPHLIENDILFCEFEMHSKTRIIKKLPDNQHYFVNQQPYAFTRFPQMRKIERDFQPFLTSGPAKASSEKKARRSMSLERSSETKEKATKNELSRLEKLVDRLKQRSNHSD